MNFVVPADNKMKIIESEKSNKYLDLAKEVKERSKIRVTVIPILIGALETVNRFALMTGRLESWRTYWDFLDYIIVEIG